MFVLNIKYIKNIQFNYRICNIAIQFLSESRCVPSLGSCLWGLESWGSGSRDRGCGPEADGTALSSSPISLTSSS